ARSIFRFLRHTGWLHFVLAFPYRQRPGGKLPLLLMLNQPHPLFEQVLQHLPHLAVRGRGRRRLRHHIDPDFIQPRRPDHLRPGDGPGFRNQIPERYIANEEPPVHNISARIRAARIVDPDLGSFKPPWRSLGECGTYKEAGNEEARHTSHTPEPRSSFATTVNNGYQRDR